MSTKQNTEHIGLYGQQKQQMLRRNNAKYLPQFHSDTQIVLAYK
jgi:hypothetical protein